ncbi:MAG: 50S ribosomal protein L21 [Candidatus Marinimicrobia bacterium]|nr:50S ribosomal protein L21 [Candidatus Neomarinimicrobiota bacterium]MBL7023378.1 50S ribosomal protein L21 [Candidatus Neomarinimicrobiota bacterium]MBL7109741.1 50S ribosomal protein L21 [Candidatus Neomarinimicrobiota bacterium]
MYALVDYLGKQFKIEPGVEVKVPLISGKVGEKVTLDKVLYFDDDKKKIIGEPFIKGMSLDAKIVSHGRERKIIVFKMKRRKGYQKKQGHRQNYSVIVVDKVEKKVAPNKTKPATAKKTVTKSKTKATVKKTTVVKKTDEKKKG